MRKEKNSKDPTLEIDKEFKTLTIRNDFMFCKVMQNAGICKEVLELVLGKKIEEIEQIISQSTIQNTSENKGVRLDSCGEVNILPLKHIV